MIRIPPLIRINSVLIFLVLFILVMYYARHILIIVSFAVFLSMLMAPVSNFLENHRFNRVSSTIVSIFIVLLVISFILFLIVLQIMSFVDDIPSIQKRLEGVISSMQGWIDEHFHISNKDQIASLKKNASSLLNNIGIYMTGIITGTASFIGSFILVFVFLFLLLYSRERYIQFFIKIGKKEQAEEMEKVIEKISKVAQRYLAGRLISIVLLAVFYAIGLIIIGIENAVLLAVIASVVTIIPYVGPILGGAFPFFMALVTEDSFGPALGVIVVITFVQTLDNYFVEPYVVGGNVNINAFFTILILIAGGMLWGIAGVLLFLPMLGMVKIIFDNVKELQPYAFLIGDDDGSEKRVSRIWKKISGIKESQDQELLNPER